MKKYRISIENERKIKAFYLSLGENIKRIRKLKGFTQTDLSDKTGLSIHTIGRIEASNYEYCTSISTLFLIADALDVCINSLFTGEIITLCRNRLNELERKQMLSNNIKKIRKAKHLNQMEVTILTGMSRSTIQHMENGRSRVIAELKSLFILADAMGVTIDEFFTGIN